MTARSQFKTPPPAGRIALPQSPTSRTLLLCPNRRAGSGERLQHVEHIVGALEKHGYVLHLEHDLDSLSGVARELHGSNQLRAAVAIGGDGTASAVRERVPLEIPMLVVPMGTENLLGNYLRQSIDPVAVVDVIENGVIIDLDLGWANGRPFLLMISAGFDAEVVRALHETRRGNIRRATYILPILSAIKRYAFHPMQIYWDPTHANGSESTSCRWIFGFNLPLYALGLPIAPNADGTDGLLNVCAFKRGSTWNVFRYLWHVSRKVHHNLPDAVIRQTQHFRIESVGNTPIAFQLDGDFGGMLPVEVKVIPRQLRLLVNRETAERIGFTVSNISADKT